MKFYIYHRPLKSIRRKEFIGDLIHISEEDKFFSPDGEEWSVKSCNQSKDVYNRLLKMLRHAGMDQDMTYPLDCKRSVKDLINYMNKWENK